MKIPAAILPLAVAISSVSAKELFAKKKTTGGADFLRGPNENASDRAKEIVGYWTPARRAGAVPRDLLFDPVTGQGYIKDYGTKWDQGNGSGKQKAYATTKYGSSGKRELSSLDLNANEEEKRQLQRDFTPPDINNMIPDGITVTGNDVTFRAEITDSSPLKSVSFVIESAGRSFTPSCFGNGQPYVCQIILNLSGDGKWAWHVRAKDRGARGGNLAVSPTVTFTVEGGGGTCPAGDCANGPDFDQVNCCWDDASAVQEAAGRLLFTSPDPAGVPTDYFCSGTVVQDNASGRSVVLTAAHCVYDGGVFSWNVMFIPSQYGTTGSGTDDSCANDVVGCWVNFEGVIDKNWADRSWHQNIPWDYAFLVVEDNASNHVAGLSTPATTLDQAVTPLEIDFTVGSTGTGSFTRGIGYTYLYDPNLMYCSGGLDSQNSPDYLYMPNCGLGGGSSGGPWQSSSDRIVGVNSFGPSTGNGMGGPLLSNGGAECVHAVATQESIVNTIVDTAASPVCAGCSPACNSDSECGGSAVCLSPGTCSASCCTPDPCPSSPDRCGTFDPGCSKTCSSADAELCGRCGNDNPECGEKTSEECGVGQTCVDADSCEARCENLQNCISGKFSPCTPGVDDCCDGRSCHWKKWRCQ